ncbi:MAG: isopentenyl-diphosphate Delta-isomerase [Actinomycetota bacterium]|nr:isopentenyl-diphosphate Delta-isomerase [Actinomycetota bacterium]
MTRNELAGGGTSSDVLVVSVGQDGTAGPAVPRGAAHEAPAVLHLAVSVQLVDLEGGWLLQRRAGSKAAFADRWANSCCTHPAPGEDLAAAAMRRVREELGLEIDELIRAGMFTYRATDPQSGMVEYEQDHVFAAVADTRGAVAAPEEISALLRPPFSAAMDIVASDAGTPWAAEVLRRSFDALHQRRQLPL